MDIKPPRTTSEALSRLPWLRKPPALSCFGGRHLQLNDGACEKLRLLVPESHHAELELAMRWSGLR